MIRHRSPVVVMIVIAVGIGIFLGIKIITWLKKRQFKKRVQRGREAEENAESFLEESGFMVWDRQVASRTEYLVDGEEREAGLRADYLLIKDGKQYIAEVKSGALAPNPDYTDTRRQLLEYALAFGKIPLLLVDMESKEIHEIEFPKISKAHTPWKLLIRLSGIMFFIGALLGTAFGLRLPFYWNHAKGIFHRDFLRLKRDI